MNGRQIFSIHIVLKCQRSSEAQTFARLQYFCTFVIEIKDRMQYCMEEPKRGCWARALGTRSSYALGGRYKTISDPKLVSIWLLYTFDAFFKKLTWTFQQKEEPDSTDDIHDWNAHLRWYGSEDEAFQQWAVFVWTIIWIGIRAAS